MPLPTPQTDSPTLWCHQAGAPARTELPPQAAALGALGWNLQPAVAAATPADGALGLVWCSNGTDLEHLLGASPPQVQPALLLSPPLSAADRPRALRQQLLLWLPLEAPAELVNESLCWLRDLAQHLHATTRAAEARLDDRLNERKWTDRAKGLLMQARGIDEPTAFALLRDTAMQTQTRLPVVAQGVVRTAELAEALERAGAQRMLSQRLVKLQALCQWPGLAPAERREVLALQEASAERVRGNLARLHELLREDAAVERAAVVAAWTSLEAALAARPADLSRSDAAAQRLLVGSDALVQQLSARAGERPVALLAQVTRLRLHSQQLAKASLLGQLQPERDPAEVAQSLDDFLRAYAEVRAAPLAGPALQPAFAAVDEAWHLLLRGLRTEQGGAAQRLHQGSERLLQALEGLTQALQTSLQLILG